jgi:peptide deformylase
LLYNPRVVAAEETAAGEEGSVSLPGARVSIDRPVWADIAWMDETGAAHAERFTGFLARVAIHEIEQMQGIFFLDRLSRLKREMALKKARKHAG